MFSIFGPNEKFKSGRGALITHDDSATSMVASLKKKKDRTAEEDAEFAIAKSQVKTEKAFDAKLSKRPYALQIVSKPSVLDLFDWSYTAKVIWVAICIICMLLPTAFAKQLIKGINFDGELLYAGLKPGSYVKVYNTVTKELEGYEIVEGGALRTINDSVPTDANDVKALAYKLYNVGNTAMVTNPYASYFETGTNSTFIVGQTLPLSFSTVDIHNNVTGERVRQTMQYPTPGYEMSTFIKTLAGAFASEGKRWYTSVDSATTVYQSTNALTYDDNDMASFNWSKLNNNNELPEARKKINLNPIPYFAAAKIGNVSVADNAVTGMSYSYDAENDYTVPRILDGAGREIGYEKTDQHIYYDPTHASKEDANGNLIEDYYTTIKEATVSYNEEGQYYEVHMIMDSEKEYTHIDTLWALQDEKGAQDPDAKFTKFEVKFQLWDNGYFKQWEMWEDWEAPNAKGFLGRMAANQYYKAVFSYDEDDASLEKYSDWAKF